MVSTTNKNQLTIGIICLMAISNQIQAAEFVVQTNMDTGGLTASEISPNIFSIDTLRSAIEQANDESNFPGHDIIRFDENINISRSSSLNTTIHLSQTGDQFNFQNQSSNSALPIDSVITIQGTLPGAPEAPVVLEAIGLRHFQVNNGGKLRLYNITLQNGETPLNSAGRGGSVVVLSHGKLETNGATFFMNQAVNGGAVAFQSGSLDGLIENSKFFFNDASDENPGTDQLGSGGAIYTDLGANSIVIENSYFSSNDADANGGAIYVNRPFVILNSKFEYNDATLNGGGLYVDEEGEFTLSNSLLFDNVSQLRGGAIYTTSTTMEASQIFNSTLTKNKAGFGIISRVEEGVLTAGGGIYSAFSGNLVIHNNIVAKNEDTGMPDDVAAQVLSSSGFNLIGVDGQISGVTHNSNGNLIGTVALPIDPGLKLNQILTSVIGLESSSPAINSGSDAQVIVAGLSTDIDGNDRIIGSAVDRGAHETDVFFYNGFE